MSEDVEALTEIEVLLTDHSYRPSGLRGVSSCGCGFQFHGMQHEHRAHVALILTGWLVKHDAEVVAKALTDWADELDAEVNALPAQMQRGDYATSQRVQAAELRDRADGLAERTETEIDNIDGVPCSACGGSGEVDLGRREPETGAPITEECRQCEGKGY